MRPEDRALTVALAPDAPLVTAGVSAMLSAADPDIVVVALADAAQSACDVVLYDPLAFDPAELETPAPTLVAFSWSTRTDVVSRARSHGAVALLSKLISAGDLVASIRSLHAGRRTRFVLGEPGPDRDERADGLTARELEVLQLIAQGCSNDEIASRLFLSVNSVKTYIRTGYRKLGITRRPQAVLWAVQEGIAVRRDAPPVP